MYNYPFFLFLTIIIVFVNYVITIGCDLYIVLALSLLLITRNRLCKAEVVRVFGNLTRSATVRNYLLETGGKNNILNIWF